MRHLNTFFADAGGAAAVELALAVPVLAGMVILSFDVWDATNAQERAAVASKAAVSYYFNGGISDAEATTIGTEAWANPPADARVTVRRTYRCDETVNATSLCSDGLPADTYAIIEAFGSSQGLVYRSTFKVTRNVRIR